MVRRFADPVVAAASAIDSTSLLLDCIGGDDDLCANFGVLV